MCRGVGTGGGRPHKFAQMENKLDDLKIDFLEKSKLELKNNEVYDAYLHYMCKFRWYELKNTYDKDLTKSTEEEINSLQQQGLIKDVAKFTKDEVETMLLRFRISTLSSLETQIAVLNKYRIHARAMQKIPSMLMIEYRPTDEEKKELIHTKDKLITKSELYYLCDEQIVNAQDSGIFLSIFNFGKNNDCEDIINLTLEDIDKENNIVHLKDRDVEVDNITIEHLIRANNEIEYKKGNGDPEVANSLRKPTIDLEDTNYIFKNGINAQRGADDKISIQTIRRRTKNMSKLFDRPYLNLTNVADSGKLYKIQMNMKETNREIDDYSYNEIREILKNFGEHTDSQIVRLKRLNDVMNIDLTVEEED